MGRYVFFWVLEVLDWKSRTDNALADCGCRFRASANERAVLMDRRPTPHIWRNFASVWESYGFWQIWRRHADSWTGFEAD